MVSRQQRRKCDDICKFFDENLTTFSQFFARVSVISRRQCTPHRYLVAICREAVILYDISLLYSVILVAKCDAIPPSDGVLSVSDKPAEISENRRDGFEI